MTSSDQTCKDAGLGAPPPTLKTPPGSTPPRSTLRGYAVAVLSVAVVAAFRLAAWPILKDEIPWIPFALSVIVAARYGGFRAGLAATLLSMLATGYVLLKPYHLLALSAPANFTGMVVFGVSGVLISWIVKSMRAAQRQAEELADAHQSANEQLQAQAEELAAANEELQAQAEESQRYIDESARAQGALQESEERFRALIENGSDVVSLVKDGVIQYASPSVTRSLGYAPEEVTDRALMDLVHPDDLAHALSVREHVLRHPGEDVTFECRLRHQDGSWRTLETVARNRGAEPAVSAIVLNSRDITDRKRVRDDLARLRQAVENTGEAIFLTDREGTITLVNPEFCRLYGHTAEEVVGRVTPRILKSGTASIEEVQAFWGALLAGKIIKRQLINKTKDGRLVTIEATASPIIDENGQITGFLAIQRNITERIRLEEEFQHAQKMEAIGRLAGGVAHDFNNVLMPILTYGQLLLQILPPDERLQRYAEQVVRNAERAASLPRQLLAFSRKQVIQPTVVDLNAVISDLQKMLRRLIGEDIHLEVSLAPALGRLKADRGQVEQVVMNLVVNARDAMPTGGTLALETADVVVAADDARHHLHAQPGPHVLLTVTDMGCGMDHETQSRIFEPFFTTKEQGKGTGLGLSTVFGIVTGGGGHIRVQSQPGKGTTFQVFLPRVDDAQPDEGTSPDRQSPAGGTESVLLVEDDRTVRDSVREVLASKGYRVLEASDGNEALARCTTHDGPIDLLLTDLVMPAMGGRELAQRVLALRPQVRVLYISGYTEDTLIQHGGVLDPNIDLLQKPFAPNDLAAKVREVLDRP